VRQQKSDHEKTDETVIGSIQQRPTPH